MLLSFYKFPFVDTRPLLPLMAETRASHADRRRKEQGDRKKHKVKPAGLTRILIVSVKVKKKNCERKTMFSFCGLIGECEEILLRSPVLL